jgi:hypothetical protein
MALSCIWKTMWESCYGGVMTAVKCVQHRMWGPNWVSPSLLGLCGGVPHARGVLWETTLHSGPDLGSWCPQGPGPKSDHDCGVAFCRMPLACGDMTQRWEANPSGSPQPVLDKFHDCWHISRDRGLGAFGLEYTVWETKEAQTQNGHKSAFLLAVLSIEATFQK